MSLAADGSDGDRFQLENLKHRLKLIMVCFLFKETLIFFIRCSWSNLCKTKSIQEIISYSGAVYYAVQGGSINV